MKPFFKISFRHLWQSRLYAAINVIGLTAGIACMLFAVLYWNDERSFDSFHTNNPNLYRVTTTLIENKGERLQTVGGTGQVQGPAFKEAVPEVKTYVRILGGDIYSDVIAGEKTLHLQPLFVDSNFFDVFSFPLVYGNAKKVLSDINAAVVTESTAKKFFNTVDVAGRILQLDADPSYNKLGKPLVISGVVKDPPANSSLQFDILFSFSFLRLSFEDHAWLNAYLGTFVVLDPHSDVNSVVKKFDAVYKMHAKEQLAENSKLYGYDPQITYGLQPITEMHLDPLMRTNGNAEGGVINGSSPVYSYMFLGIAAFILLMASINFINISIAGSLKRSKEVGIRKISGGSRWQIIVQFIYESAILCLVAFVLSLVVINLSLPLFNSLAGKHIQLGKAFNVRLIASFTIVLTVIVLLTALYPAVIISRFNPSEVLYNKQKLSGKDLFGRALVVLQFSLAVFLLIATLVYYNQMDYLRTKDLGYNPNQIIRTNINGDRDYRSAITYLRNELAKEPSIKSLSFGNDGWPETMEVNNKNFKAHYKNIDENFLSAMQIPLKLGSNISTIARDAVLVNEAFIKEAHIQTPVGTRVKIYRYGDTLARTITGVVKDFHFGSLREPIGPMLMYTNEVPDGSVWVRFDKSKQKDAMAALERIYKYAMPGAVFQYNFLDELNAAQYVQERRWLQVVTAGTVLSFIICCLGLFGLAHLSTNRRTKEIGIRKVLGASVSHIVTLISVDFLKLVCIAFVVAAPVSWMIMNKWLQNFAYRINVGISVFVTAAILAIIIALMAVTLQSIKAAIANPVNSLRNE